MAALIDSLLPARRGAASIATIDDWAGLWGLDGLAMMLSTTMPRENESSDGTFASLVQSAYLRNSIVFACLAARARLFSEARFQFQQLRGGKPGNLFGTSALTVLERPEPGKTTRDLLQSAILDADLGGNGFNLGRRDAIRRLRPDWMTIAYGSRRPGSDLGSWDPEAEVIGYGYQPGGWGSGEDLIVYGPEEISHFAPTKDPLARNRGISLLTAGLREVLADNGATTHKLAFFNNAATPNLALKFPPTMGKDKAREWIELFEQEHRGASRAFRTIFLGAGVEPVAVGLDFKAMDFAAIQGKAETRIAALTGMHPVVVALSEGLQGSSLNAGNFGSARRLVGDATLRPLWGDMAGSLETIVPPPSSGTRLWYDEGEVAFLREDVKDQASIMQLHGATIGQLIRDGFTPASAVDYLLSGDLSRLVHTGLVSVQLQPPMPEGPPAPELPTAYRARTEFWPSQAPLELYGVVPAGAVYGVDHPLVVAYPSLFDREPAPAPVPQLRPGPAPIVTKAEVLAKRAELQAAGLPAGRESLARALYVSPDTIRRRLNGD